MSASTRLQNFILGPPSSKNDFRRNKLAVALSIMIVGMVLALGWAGVQGWGFGRGYPDNAILLASNIRYGDYLDLTMIARLPNPYLDPTAFYLPFQWLCLRLLAWMPAGLQITVYCFVGLGILFLLLEYLLRKCLEGPVRRTVVALVLLVLSYPVLFCLDRANVEFVVAAFVAGAIFVIGRARYILGALALAVAMSFKFPPVVLIALLLRQGRTGLAALSLVIAGTISVLSLLAMSCPLDEAWSLYSRNMTYYLDFCVYQNNTLEGCASPWNAFKVLVLAAGHWGIIAPVDFNYDTGFVRTSFTVYSIVMGLLGAGLVAYAVFLERHFARAVVTLLLFLSIDAPSGADYRLLYAGMALAILISLDERRRHDMTVVVLLALAMVPKKEIFLPFAGISETGALDVSIQVVLNPLLVLVAIFLFLWAARGHVDGRWIRLRLGRMVRGFIGSRFTPRPADAKIAA